MFEGIDFFSFIPVQEHFGTTIDQEASEYEQYPSESADESGSSKDENEAKHDGSKDSPV